MELKYIAIGIAALAIVLIIAAVFIFSQQKNLGARCCAECSEAFSKSPVAIGAEGANCGGFSTAQPLSKKCKNYFEKNTKTVFECK